MDEGNHLAENLVDGTGAYQHYAKIEAHTKTVQARSAQKLIKIGLMKRIDLKLYRVSLVLIGQKFAIDELGIIIRINRNDIPSLACMHQARHSSGNRRAKPRRELPAGSRNITNLTAERP